MTNYIGIIAVGVITLIGSIFMSVVGMKRYWSIAVAFTLAFTGAIVMLTIVLLEQSKSNVKFAISEASTVPTLDSITNGLYRVMATYNDGNGGHLTIIHRQTLVTIDTLAHKIETSQADQSPVLLRTTSPILLPGTTNIITNGLIEIGVDGDTHFAREFNPFRHLIK